MIGAVTATTPLISLPAFMIGFIAVLLIGRGIVELYIYYSEQKKSPQDCANNPAGERRQLSPSQKTIQRYYNKNIKGA